MALNLGESEALIRRVAAAYAQERGRGCEKDGLVRSHFARFLGVNPSDVTRWEAGEREAGAYLLPKMVRYLAKTFGDPMKAARVVYGPQLEDLGLDLVVAKASPGGDLRLLAAERANGASDFSLQVTRALADGVVTEEEAEDLIRRDQHQAAANDRVRAQLLAEFQRARAERRPAS